MRNIMESGYPSGDGAVFAAARFSTRASEKTETIASNFPWLEVRELWQKGEEDDHPEDRRNPEIPAERSSL